MRKNMGKSLYSLNSLSIYTYIHTKMLCLEMNMYIYSYTYTHKYIQQLVSFTSLKKPIVKNILDSSQWLKPKRII